MLSNDYDENPFRAKGMCVQLQPHGLYPTTLLCMWISQARRLEWVAISFSIMLGVKALVIQSCPTLCDPMDYSPPGSSVHGILQARILEWVSISSSRRSSPPRDRTWVSCIAGQLFTN